MQLYFMQKKLNIAMETTMRQLLKTYINLNQVGRIQQRKIENYTFYKDFQIIKNNEKI